MASPTPATSLHPKAASPKRKKKEPKTCLFEGGVEGLQSMLQNRGCSCRLGKAGGREGFGKALLAPPGSPIQAARHGSQQLLLTDGDGRGPRNTFSYELCTALSCRTPCLPPPRPFPRRSEWLTRDGSSTPGMGAAQGHAWGQDESRPSSSSSSLLSSRLQQDGRRSMSHHPRWLPASLPDRRCLLPGAGQP